MAARSTPAVSLALSASDCVVIASAQTDAVTRSHCRLRAFVGSFASDGAHQPSLSVTSLTARSAAAAVPFRAVCVRYSMPVGSERQSAERGSFSAAYFDRTTEDNPSRYSLLRRSRYCCCWCCWCCCCCGDWRKMLLILLPYHLSAAKW